MYHVYTHNDLDGIGCGILAKLAFGEQVEVRYNSVQGLNVQVERFLEKNATDDILYITDLSVNSENEEKINQFTEKGGNVTLIDHHKTATHLNEYSWGHVTVEYEDGRLASATSLFYEHLVKQDLLKTSPVITEFVELVRQWDTWEWDANDNVAAKRLNDLFFMISMEDFEERMVNRLKEADQFSFDEFEEKILDMEEKKIERYIQRKRRELVQTFIHDLCVGIVHAESYHSELGNELGKDCPHLDYIAILNLGGKKISFRTIHDHIDVSKVAGHYSGGGHAKASGCSMNEEAYKAYIAEPFKLNSLRLDAPKNQQNIKEGKNGSLYTDYDQNLYYIYQTNETWTLDVNKKAVQTFDSFSEAERLIKRDHQAWLVKDDAFVEYLEDVGKK